MNLQGEVVTLYYRRPSCFFLSQGSGLSKGGLSRLAIRLRLTAIGANSQIASGIWLTTSFSSGSVPLYAKVMSNFPATNANIAVDRLRMIVYSMPSR